jgi:hypothetical protein
LCWGYSSSLIERLLSACISWRRIADPQTGADDVKGPIKFYLAYWKDIFVVGATWSGRNMNFFALVVREAEAETEA